MFVFQRLKALAELETLQVCSPAPWFPFIKQYRQQESVNPWQGLSVHRPGYFYVPGCLKDYDAHFYARGLQYWLKKLCRAWQPDLLDAHFVWPDGVGVASLAQKIKLPYVITLRGKIYECLKSPSQTKQCAKALKGAATVISVSSKMADEARKLGVADHRIHVIPNGVDREHFKIRDKAECRQLLGLPRDCRILVTVAHLGHRKGHHEVIKALASLPDDVSLVIVGGPAQGGTAEKLQKVAQEAGVVSRVILPGPQPYDRVPYYFSAADASILASYREGCPNAVLESLACGTPVVATDVGAVPDILPESLGYIIPQQQVEPLRAAMADVLSKSWDARQVVADSGVRSWGQVAANVQMVFGDIMNNHGSTHPDKDRDYKF